MNINEKIIERYEKESTSTCNLSCGNNINYLQIIPGEKILDLGCGKGLETIQAASLAKPNGFAVGLDLTQNMIDTAALNAKKLDIDNVDFVVGNIEELPFEDGIFDCVISNCVINHAKNKNIVFSEIYRVLKKSGRFVISDAVTKNSLPIEIKTDPNSWAECFGGAITYDEYIVNIEKAGFGNVTLLNKREYIKNNFDFMSITIKSTK